MVVSVTAAAFKHSEVAPHLPVDFSPGNAVGFTDESDELFEVPGTVDHVLGAYLAVLVDIALCLGAVEYLALAQREELIAVGALVEVVALLL